MLLLLLPSAAEADWRDLREGHDPSAVREAIGEPLIVTQGLSRAFMTWTYDEGGYAIFFRGRLRYWQDHGGEHLRSTFARCRVYLCSRANVR